MTNLENHSSRIFKYKMSFYYQSTIIYFSVFCIYLLIRGEFVENSFTLIIKDPILYALALIVIISIASLFYNLILNRHLQVSEQEISFIKRNKKKSFNFKDIKNIKIIRSQNISIGKSSQLIKIAISGRRKPVTIRPSYYENESQLIEIFQSLKNELTSNNV
ncbi:MAG: hypothetical protein IPJ03_05605 [Ignavibacteriales bacterium]|nr:hypothetical protein [Ignavibacteriales bacterium]